jgi:predicted DNA-binding protein
MFLMNKQRKVHTAVLLEPDDKERLQALAQRGDRTFSQEVRRAIRLHLERESVGDKT